MIYLQMLKGENALKPEAAIPSIYCVAEGVNDGTLFDARTYLHTVCMY